MVLSKIQKILSNNTNKDKPKLKETTLINSSYIEIFN